MELFDVTTLHYKPTHELLTKYQEAVNMFGLSIQQFMVLLEVCWDCSIFRWPVKYLAQTRWMTMRQRLAPNLAIAFIFKIEAPVIDPGHYSTAAQMVYDLREQVVSQRLEDLRQKWSK
ncbi:hypothetical protein KIN20_033525 [Parelaphostrongylus tenuis]|uniref:Uncharacterized protein n=1 Tax=Parelaphostrongylus tenuis TaxID=148309 RepID=A0AAD5WIV5_PARTN|nr:hypothetical protein KIN20_033525 [Parelaphostrongylus tenuis]